MVQEITDSLQVLMTDTIQDSLPQSDYFIGNIIPLTPGETVFPSDLVTADSQLRIIYSSRHDAGLALPESNLNRDFCFGMLSFSLVLVALISVYGRKSILSPFTLLGFSHKTEPALGSASEILSWPALIRFLFTILNIGLFTTMFLVMTGIISSLPGVATIKIFGIASGIITGMTLIRHLLCIIVAAFTGQRALFMEYVAVIYSVWFVSSLLFFILSSIILFIPVNEPSGLLWSGVALAVILIILRILRLLNIFIKRRVSILYFILYLCALEVLPVLIVIKALGAF